MDWGTLTVKDLVYAAVFFGALVLGHKKVWCWFYQLEDCKASYEAQLRQQREDFLGVIAIERQRGDEFKDLVIEARGLVVKSVEVAKAVTLRPAS